MNKILTTAFLLIFISVISLFAKQPVIKFPVSAEVEPNNTSTQANTISIGDSLVASISVESDVDYYKITVAAGDTIDVFCSDVNGSNLDGRLDLFNESGNTLRYNDDFIDRKQSRIVYNFTVAGTYYLRFLYYGNYAFFPNRPQSLESDKADIKKANYSPQDYTSGEYSIVVRRFSPEKAVADLFSVNNVFENSLQFVTRFYPFSDNTNVNFEWGETEAFGNTVPANGNPYSGISRIKAYSNHVSGFTPGTFHYLRGRFENPQGVSYTQSFTMPMPAHNINWNVQNNNDSGYIFRSVTFPTKEVGYVVGDYGRIYKTTDAGSSWNSQYYSSIFNFFSVSFCDVNNGVIVGSSPVILKTTDGGINWIEKTAPSAMSYISVVMLNINTIIFSTSEGQIFKSTDGGDNWSVINTGSPQYLYNLFFVNSNIGFAAGNNGVIIKTTNGGDNWTVLSSGVTGALEGIHFVNENIGYAVGRNNVILKTTNGGENWLPQSAATSGDFMSVAFSDENNGLIVGLGGVMLKTTNGGADWLIENSGTYNDLFHIRNNSAKDFAIAGQNDLVMRAKNEIWITSPGGGDAFVSNNYTNITWFTTGFIGNVKIDYTTDGGFSWNNIIASTPSSAGTYNWHIPPISTTTLNIRISDTDDPAIYAVTGGYITIMNVGFVITSPSGGEQWAPGSSHDITWNSFGMTDFKIDYSLDAGNNWFPLVASTPAATGSYLWTIPIFINPTSYAQIRLSDPLQPNIFITSSLFSIKNNNPILEVEPNNGLVTANALAYGDSVLAGINPELPDIDLYSFYALAGDTVDIFAATRNSSELDGRIYLLDSLGMMLAANDDYSSVLNSRLIFVIPQSGRYYIWYSHYTNVPVSASSLKKTAAQTQKTNTPTATSGDYYLLFKKLSPGVAAGRITLHQNILYNSLRVGGVIFANGLNTTVTVQYSTDLSFGNSISIAEGVVSGLSEQSFTSLQITGMQPNTRYNIRLMMSNIAGVSYSNIYQPTTPEAPVGWNIINSGVAGRLTSAAMLSQTIAFAAGYQGILLKTTNSGTRWTPQVSGIVNNIVSMSFIDNLNGYINSIFGELYKTTNGGQNWISGSINTGAIEDFMSISFSSIDVGAAVTYQGHIYLTTDGGVNWMMIAHPNTNHLRFVKFINSSTAFAVGDNGVIIKTSDGGLVWESKVSNTTGNIYSISFSDALNGFAVGTQGTVIKTTDGGETWASVGFASPYNFSSVSCYGSNQAIIAGDWGILYKTTNGGANWVLQKSGTNNNLTGISMINAGSGILVGDFGYLAVIASSLSLSSPAGGESWIIGSSHNITWSSNGVNNVKIEYSINNGSTWLTQAASVPAATGNYNWIVPNSISPQVKIRISDVDNSSLFSISNTFSITGHGTFTEIEPNNISAQANVIALADSVHATINIASDVDYYSFSASAGDTLEIISNHRNSSGLNGLLILYSADGTMINSSYYFTDNNSARILYVFSTSGVYYIRFSSTSNAGVFPNRTKESTDPYLNESASINTNVGDYSLVLRKFVPAKPAIGWIIMRNLYSNAFRVECNFYPMGLSTNVSIEYGATTSYGATAQAVGNPYSADIQPKNAISGYIAILEPNTLYHYRIKAVNSMGTGYSSDLTFTTPESGAGWMPFTITGAELQPFMAVKAFDQNNAFTVGTTGYRTSNAGLSWAACSGINASISDLSFIDANIGYAVGSAGQVFKTTNGGSVWAPVATGLSSGLSSVSFVDVNNGFTVGLMNQTLYKTTNGGANWNQITLTNIDRVTKINMLNLTTGYMCGNNGSFAKTTDGGGTWTYHSIAGQPYLNDLYCKDINTIFIVGSGGIIVKSTNGGASWANIASSVNNTLNKITFSDANNGLIVGSGGVILRTTDGGNSWLPQNSGTIDDLYGVSMANDLAFVSGPYGVIGVSVNSIALATPVGGENWLVGSSHNISWYSTGVSKVKIDYSTNNGSSWIKIADSVETNTGSFPWTLPSVSTTQAKVKLTSIYDTTKFSMSNNVFTIAPRGSITETEPNNSAELANAIIYGDSVLAVINPSADVDYFSFYAQAGDTIDVLYSSVNGSNYDGTVKLYDSNGLYLWSGSSYNNFGSGVIKYKLVYNFTTAGTYYLRVAQTGNTGVFPNKKASLDDEKNLADAENQQNGGLAAGEYSLRFRKFVSEAPGFIYGTLNPVFSLNYNKAILQCLVITNNLPTTVTFEYGTSTSYGSQVNSNGSIVPVLQYSFCTSSSLTGLTGNTTYHFRIKAQNALGVTYTPDGTFTTPITPTNWIILNDPIGGTINAVQVIDANVFYAAKSTIAVKSTDGGNTWVGIPFSSGVPNIWGLSFLDANTGYAAGSNGFIAKTVNGGALWSNQTSGTSQQLKSIHFLDVNNGFAAGTFGTILKTTNGGAGWVTLTSGTTANLNKIRMADINNIIICGDNGLFLKSTNAGLAWTSQTISSGVHFADLYSLDVSTYFVIGGNLVYKTTNSGATWTNISPASLTFTSLSFSNQDDGIIISNEGKIFRTNNGGTSWYSQNSGSANILNCISYVNNIALIGGYLNEYIKSGNYIHIKTPAGGETLYAGTVYPVTWAQAGIANVKIELSTDDGANWQVITPSTPGGANLYNWNITAVTAVNHCKIKVSDAANLSMSSISDGTFSIYSYPSAPVPVSPPSNSSGQPTTLTLVWRSALNAVKYVLEVAKDPSFNLIVVRDTVTSDTTRLISGLLNNTQYFWKVVSLNAAGSSPNSAVWNFTTIAAAPMPPVIIAPANNSTGIPSSTLFIWNASATALTYHIQISTDSLFAVYFFRDSTLTDTLKIITGLANGTVYYWRLCAKGAGGTGNWSPVTKFTTSTPSSTIIGTLKYANSAKTPLQDVKIILSNSTSKIDSTVTGAGGAFTFSNVTNGVYTLSENTTKEWNGVNSTDALLIRRYLSGLGILDSLQIKCADVNGNGSLNSTDALIIRRRLAGAITSFTVADWVFENPTLSLSGTAVNLNLRALCTGDVNGSYTPAAAKQNALIELIKENNLQAVVNKEFDVPIFTTQPVNIGAVTLFLSYPQELVSLISIKSKLSGFEYGSSDGKIVIAWDDVNAYKANDNEPLFILKFNGNKKFTDGVKFGLDAREGTEIADAEGNPLKGALLKTPTVEAFVPKELNLEQNYPNPFNPSTQINYQIPKQGFVTLKLYDVIGNLVAVLVDEEKEAGNYTIQYNFNSSKIASGVYFYELKFMNTIRVRKMMILK